MTTLYPHQLDLVEQVRASMARGNRAILIQFATGGGKSVLSADLIRRCLEKGFNASFVVPRRELVRQMAATFEDFEIPFSYVAAGYEFNPFSRVHVCSAGTLKNRMDRIKPKIIFIDETHYGGAVLDKIIRFYKAQGCYVIGLSATPWRLDGTGLGIWYDDMICGPSISWLMDNKYLSQYRPFAPDRPNLSQIKTVAGDYNRGQLADMMEHDNILIGNAVKHYRDHAMGRLNIAYTTSRKHSEIVAQSFRDSGISAMSIDGETPEDERKRIIRGFARREILCLVNCELLTFGFDLASAAGMDVTVESMSDLRPTKSLSLQLQKWGRVLRKKDFPALIFDHGGNMAYHGLPDDERQWSLQGQTKQDRENSGRADSVKTCDKCALAHRPAPVCPYCGNVYEINSREVDEIDGDLMEMTPDELRTKREKEQQNRLYQLIGEAKKRGYKNPEAWAAKTITQAALKRGRL